MQDVHVFDVVLRPSQFRALFVWHDAEPSADHWPAPHAAVFTGQAKAAKLAVSVLFLHPEVFGWKRLPELLFDPKLQEFPAGQFAAFSVGWLHATVQVVKHWLCAVEPWAELGWLAGHPVHAAPFAKKFALHTNVATGWVQLVPFAVHPLRTVPSPVPAVFEYAT